MARGGREGAAPKDDEVELHWPRSATAPPYQDGLLLAWMRSSKFDACNAFSASGNGI